MPVGRVMSEMTSSSCAVYALVTISGYVHGCGSSVELHTRHFSVTSSSFRVLSQSGYFCVRQLATLALQLYLRHRF